MSQDAPPAGPQPVRVVIEQKPDSLFSRMVRWGTWAVFMASLLLNLALLSLAGDYFSLSTEVEERFHSGTASAREKLAIIRVSGTIMPPFTERILDQIRRAGEDDQVKGVLLVVNSPGGFVADSHQIYHRLVELREKHHKPIVVAMGSIAASGGYYVAMGAGAEGRIFAEPTTWTGSIGVIIPRFEVTTEGESQGLADKLGVRARPLKTGPYKDSLSPFRTMTADEEAIWTDLIHQALDQFLTVIDDGRATLTRDQVRQLATGQVFSAKDALGNGLIDAIGYEEDALQYLKEKVGLAEARVVEYATPPGLIDLLLGARAESPSRALERLLDASVPRAMYHCSWLGPLPAP